MFLFSLKFSPNLNVQLHKHTISTTKTLIILLKPILLSFPFQLLQLYFSFVWVKNCAVILKYSLFKKKISIFNQSKILASYSRYF